MSTDLEKRCLTLFIWHKIEIRDEVRVLTYSLKVRFESKIIFRSLTEDTGIKCCPRKGTLMSGTLLKSCFVPKRISCVRLFNNDPPDSSYALHSHQDSCTAANSRSGSTMYPE